MGLSLDDAMSLTLRQIRDRLRQARIARGEPAEPTVASNAQIDWWLQECPR